ncbi:glycoside hydrolase family 36 protein [Galbibacter mesophilus]|uniref:glycoside hydrolase family 36 protein n=1 Tax=Galbibacter mesophilus TaxID=379069 RepID=UPI00191D6162|nr:glycoside hydrolase family 36 protein [Galbibacter mesophilus]MCM5663290.1 alpha-galactosidase [Galbibacter mesophilus]
MNFKFIYFSILICSSLSFSQNNKNQKNSIFEIANASVSRSFNNRQNNWQTAFIHLKDSKDTLVGKSKDFSFLWNGKRYSGLSDWTLVKTTNFKDEDGGKGLSVTLKEKVVNPSVEITIFYVVYSDIPVIRKWIQFKNLASKESNLEDLTVEDLSTNLNKIDSWVYHNYARMKHLMKYEGDWDDPLVVVHDHSKRAGIALGNEAVGVLKRTAFHTTENNVEIGLTKPSSTYPFRKWLAPNETWESYKTFICLYSNRNDGFDVVNNEVNTFTTQYMKPQVLKLNEKPTFVYNTWYPFRTHINDSLIRSVAKSAAACGIEEFVIDDGWQVNAHGKSSIRGWGENYGDWHVDKTKFPNGLKPVFDYIKSLGMKPGLWISIASATKDSKVYKEHPEWFVKDEEGKIGNLHFNSEQDQGFYTASFGTEWKDYIKDVIVRLVKDYGLAYAKLDLAVVSSPYVNNDSIAGSYAKGHLYKDHSESFLVLYDRLLQFFDELHEEVPELFIDCTFETAGKLHMMDYAFAKHAEGNWLSNFEEASPVGPLRVRQMAWWRSPVMPAASLVIGNLPMDDPNFMFGFKSLVGTLPIVLGDPRKLSEEKKNLIHSWATWLKDKQKKYDYMAYRKDLPGFGEPQEGMWDGWQRINFETKKGGLVGVFKQGAKEPERTVFINDLFSDKIYDLRKAPNGELVCQKTGKDLMENGFPVIITESYGGEIFEIELLDSK